ncbi:MAG: MinD/ParA family protein [Lachnospiraceae bacterium]|nr:MinD/ParA family protein [Lachnospiraceae bacterium]
MDQATSLRNMVNERKTSAPIRKARVITITSGKGGVGKSNTSVNLALALSELGKKVIIFDADFGLANVEVMFGALPKYNLSDVIYRGKRIEDIITEGPNGIGFVSGGSGIVGLSNVNRDQLAFLIHNLNNLDGLADFIIIDTGAGISDQVLSFAMMAPEIFMITTPEPSSLTDSYSLIKALYRNPNFDKDNTTIRVIANKASTIEDGELVYQKLSSVVSKFLQGRLDYLGMVPLDSTIDKAIRQQKPVMISFPNCKASKAYKLIAKDIVDGTHLANNVKRGISEIFSSIMLNRRL